MDLFEVVRTEDFVEYHIFSLNKNVSSCYELQRIHDCLLSFVAAATENYIWQKDGLNVEKILLSGSEDEWAYLHGISHFGENIEDEWFIVYLLLMFSKQCPEIFIRLSDSDGDFLLIEAANSLPCWLQSENCNYRGYLHNGMVKIVPGRFSTSLDFILSVASFLKKEQGSTEVEKNVTRLIEKKVERYANDLNHCLHKSRVYLPGKLAVLLNVKPTLIASAVTAYCQRDVIDEKLCQKMVHFPPEDMVLRLVTFSKFLYAMISHEKESQKKNPYLRPDLVSAPLNCKERSLGFKITCGFEILASQCKQVENTDLSLSKKWVQFLNVLKRKGYFKEFVEGSKDFTNLEKQARNYFLDNTETTKSDTCCVLNILQTVDYTRCYETMKLEESQLPSSDNEKWMEVNEEIFDKLLQERFDSNLKSTSSSEVLSSALNTFLNRVSDLEGVEINTNEFIDHSCMGVDSNNLVHPVSFDADTFVPSLQKLLDTFSLENNNVDLDLSSEDTDCDESASEDGDTKSYMQLMDEELVNLSGTQNVEQSLEQETCGETVSCNEIVLVNISKSYEEQYAGSGPAGNLLHNLGLRLKAKQDE